MKWKRNLRFGALIAVMGGLLFVALHQSSPGMNNGVEATDAPSAVNVSGGDVKPAKLREVAKRIPAPDFTLDTTEGKKFTLSSMKGKGPIIVNFFTTNCYGCNQEYPHLEAIYKKYKSRGLQIVSISGEDADTLRAFAKKKGATFPLLTDPSGQVSTTYQADAVPMNFFIDSKGRAVEIVVGYDPNGGAKHIESMAEALVRDMKS